MKRLAWRHAGLSKSVADHPRRADLCSSFIYLVSWPSQRVLVDAQFYKEDVEALIDTIAAAGKRLTTIYITHGHFDHWYGAGAVAARFPGSRILALPGVMAYIGAAKEQEAQIITAMFGDRIVTPMALPEKMQGDTIDLEGHAFRAIEIVQGDIPSNTVLHSPELKTAIVGDLAYNNIHMMLGLSGPAEWDQWASNIGKIEELAPGSLSSATKAKAPRMMSRIVF